MAEYHQKNNYYAHGKAPALKTPFWWRLTKQMDFAKCCNLYSQWCIVAYLASHCIIISYNFIIYISNWMGGISSIIKQNMSESKSCCGIFHLANSSTSIPPQPMPSFTYSLFLVITIWSLRYRYLLTLVNCVLDSHHICSK